jgi:ribonuclease HI
MVVRGEILDLEAGRLSYIYRRIKELSKLVTMSKKQLITEWKLQAVIGALIALRQFSGDVVVKTDSSYVMQGITKWVHGWIKNGWMTSTKEEVLNRDLWEILTSLLYEREEKGKVDWNHISGHSGIPGNERTDEIATAFADKKEIELYDGPAEKYGFDLTKETPNRVKKEIKDEKRTRSKQPAYSYISMVDGKIETHKTWNECEKRVKGVPGAKFKKAISADEEEAIIKEWQGMKHLKIREEN